MTTKPCKFWKDKKGRQRHVAGDDCTHKGAKAAPAKTAAGETGSGAAATTESGTRRGGPPASRFPWVYVAAGGLTAVGGFLLFSTLKRRAAAGA